MIVLLPALCLGCPVTGCGRRSRRLSGSGVAVAWLPPLGAVLVMFFPYQPY